MVIYKSNYYKICKLIKFDIKNVVDNVPIFPYKYSKDTSDEVLS